MAGGMQGPASLIGQVVGGYRLERVLGKSATGAVFLGRWVQGQGERPRIEQVGGLSVELPEAVAVKVLNLPWQLNEAERADFRARFLREAETQQQRLRHPHIVTVLAYGEDATSGLIYMAQPYLRGGTLAEQLAAQTEPMPLAEATALLGQLADGLDYAHRQGVIHRDIKPANVLLNEQGQAYLSDFSIVRLLAEVSTKLTTTGGVLGTPAYMAPEQFAGAAVGPAADLYSLGMVTYEMVTGQVAFNATTIMDLIRLQVQDPPLPPRALRPDLPEPAEAALLQALAKQPDDRFATASAFAEAFAQGVQGQWAAGVARAASSTGGIIRASAPQPARMTPAPSTLPIQSLASEGYLPMAGSAPTIPAGSSYTPTMVAVRTSQGADQRKRSGWVPAIAALALLAVVGVAAYSARGALFGGGGQPQVNSTSTATGFATDTASVTDTTTATNTATTTRVPPTATPATGATCAAVPYGIAMLSPTDGWAVGWYDWGGIGGKGLSGLIAHYDGANWSTVDCRWQVAAVALVSSTSGWAVGHAGSIARFSNGGWNGVTSPTSSDLYAVALNSSNEGWAVGQGGSIIRLSGGTWTSASSPTRADMFGIAMVSAAEGWAVGANGTILHFSGGGWVVVSSPTTQQLNGIVVLSSTVGWAVGNGGTILQFNGSAWTSASGVPSVGLLNSVSATSSGNVWAVGGHSIVHYDGSTWSSHPTPNGFVGTLLSVSMDSANDGWAIGDGSTLHYAGGAWTLYQGGGPG